MDPSLIDDVTETVHAGRVTLLEYLLFQAIKLESTHHDLAVAEVTNATRSMSSVKPPLTADDIHPTLWSCVQKVLGGS